MPIFQEEPPGDLVRRIKAGDDDAREQLYRRYYPRLRVFFSRQGWSAADGDALTNETLERVFKYIGEIEDEGKFHGWLFKIARNVSHSAHARRRPGDAGPDSVAIDDDEIELVTPEPGPEGELLAQEALREALAQLSPRQRTCFKFRWQGFSYEEIARLCGISIGAVKTHLHLAREKLATLLPHLVRPPRRKR